ncbi:MAG: DUF3667 domain-containing protein [Chryseolinea sp.]
MVCKSCHQEVSGKYCSNCGQSLAEGKITVPSLLHEVFHLFTHLDHGILHTISALIKKPGLMQREYIQGDRAKHQKPFSMYFVAATATALILYWINHIITDYYHAGEAGEVVFFNKYLVMTLLVTVPISTLIVYAFFFNSEYNFAEIGVMQLYTLSVLLPMVACISLVKFIWHDFETRYIEFLLILIYSMITFYNFFDYQRKWKVLLKCLLTSAIFFFSITQLQDFIVHNFLH